MLQYIFILGIPINMYKLFFFLALASVPVMLFALRKEFQFNKRQAALYSSITLVFGLIAAWLTASLKRVMLGIASGGLYTDTERLRNYGIPIFLPLFLLVYCSIFKINFLKLTDYIAPCVYSVMTIVKIGCTFWGCCYGELDEHGIWNSMLGCKTFPVQLYDSISSFFIVIICLVLLFKIHNKHAGYIYPLGGMLFALTKGFWESFRVHESVYERSFLETGYTLWQYWLFVLFTACLLWLVIIIYREKRAYRNIEIKQSTQWRS